MWSLKHNVLILISLNMERNYFSHVLQKYNSFYHPIGFSVEFQCDLFIANVIARIVIGKCDT